MSRKHLYASFASFLMLIIGLSSNALSYTYASKAEAKAEAEACESGAIVHLPDGQTMTCSIYNLDGVKRSILCSGPAGACAACYYVRWGSCINVSIDYHFYYPDYTMDPDCFRNAVKPKKNFGGNGGTCGNTGSRIASGAIGPFVGNPINFATGNKYQEEPDLFIAGPGLPLRFVRYYNSQGGADSWTTTFSARVAVYSSLTTNLYQEDGKVSDFVRKSTDPPGIFFSEHDTSRRLENTGSGWLLTEADGRTLTFNSAGKLTRIADRNGNSQTVEYNSSGRLLSVTDNFGKQIGFGYDVSGRLHTLTTPAGEFVYEYDSNSNPIRVTRPDNTSRQYLYEDAANIHSMTGIVDENNIRYATFAYDSNNRAYLSTHTDNTDQVTIDYTGAVDERVVTDGRGNPTTYGLILLSGVARVGSSSGPGCPGCSASSDTVYEYTPRFQIRTIRYPEGKITRFTYDTRGNVLTETEASGTAQERVTTYTWHPTYSLPLTVTRKSAANPAENSVTSYTYDTNGNLTQMTETGFSGTVPISRTTTYTYNSLGQMTGIDGPRSDVSDTVTIEYYPNDAAQGMNRGMPWKTTNAAGHETVFGNYNAFGKPGTITDANGVVTTITYDTTGRMTSSVKAGLTTGFAYDGTGKLRTVTLPGNRSITYTYTAAGLLQRITDSSGNYIVYAYDANRNRTREEIHDSGGTLKKYADYEFDSYNRMEKLIHPGGANEQYAYDGNGNLTAVTDARTKITTYGYDALNRLTGMTQPGSTVTGFAYDTHDNLTGVTDARSNATAYVYDDFGRTVSVNSPDSGLTTYTHDAAGNVISKTDCNNITVNYQYDALNRLTAIVYPDSSQNVTFGYDTGAYGKGHLTSLTDASGQTAYAYNAAGQMISETRTMNGHAFVTQYGYDPVSGDLVSMTYPDGMVLTYQRDSSGQIAGIYADGQAVVSSVAYLPFGTVKNRTLGNGLTVSETFDERYQLSRIQAGTLADFQYVRDAAGNITSSSGFQIPVITTADAGDTQYSYIANRLVSTAGHSYLYDSAGNILSDGIRTFVYNQDNRLIRVSMNGVVAGEYAYDAFGRRVKKVASGITTLYHYDSSGNLIAETDGNGTPQRDYIYLNGEPLALKLYGTQAGMYFFINDHLGTPQKIVNNSAQVVWTAAYLPFGKAQVTTETVANNLRFPGQYSDAESGLHYNWHRYYDPETGRYITADPIGLSGGVNLYAYVRNNPVNLFDLLGLVDLNLHAPHEYGGTAKLPNYGLYFTVVGHGNQAWIQDDRNGTKPLSPAELATEIRSKLKPGQPVLLYSCSTGKGNNSFAQQLANELGVRVRAPTEKLTVNYFLFLGLFEIMASPPYSVGDLSNPGEMKDFFPEEH